MKQKYLFMGLVLCGLFFVFSSTYAQDTDHIVINQIYIDSVDGAGGTEDDWVELYNPTATGVVLEGWSIQKTSKTGGSLYRKKLEGIIPAYGYFLIVRNHANTSQELKDKADILVAGSGFSLSDDNTVYLVSNNEDISGKDDSDIIDLVGMGEAINFEGNASAPNPDPAKSIGRIGEGQDTDDNFLDFILVESPQARNTLTVPVNDANDEGVLDEPKEEGDEEEADEPVGAEQEVIAIEITEILPNPDGRDSGYEWVEIYQNADNQIDLSGWVIDDAGSGVVSGKSAFTFPEGTVVGGYEYLAIYIPKGKFSLNNSAGDEVRLFDNHGQLRLRKIYPGPAPSGQSYAKNISTTEWEWTGILTPGSENQFSPAAEYSEMIKISEALPDPAGPDEEGEFIELVSFDKDSVSLAGWILSDGRKRYVISEDDFFETEISSQGYFVVYRETSGIVLNNFGEEFVYLYDPSETLVDQISFNGLKKSAQSYARKTQSVYEWTTEPTPGMKNLFPKVLNDEFSDGENLDFEEGENGQEEIETESGLSQDSDEPKEVELKDIKEYLPGQRVKTSGVVVVEPGIFGERVLYLGGSGIRLYLPANFETELFLEQELSLVGVLASFHKELQLKVEKSSDIEITGEDGEIVVHPIETGVVGEETEGFLVKISGTITKTSGNTFFVDDGSGEARIYIGIGTGIEKPKMKKGDLVSVIGIVSQYDDNYRILPRYQEDLIVGGVLGKSSLPRTGVDFWLILAVLFLFFACFSQIICILFKKTL